MTRQHATRWRGTTGGVIPPIVQVIAVLGVVSGLLLGGCSRAPDPSEDGELRVLVSIPPLAGLVEAMLPEGGRVETLIPPGVSVHAYQLRPDDRARVARADLVVMVGLGLEGGATRLLESAGDRLVRFDEAVGVSAPHAGHVHGPECDHGHGPDPHLWLDPSLVLRLVGAIESRLATMEGVDQARLSAQTAALRERISEIDALYASSLADRRGRAIVTHHNAWSRLTDRYGLRVAAVLRPVATGEPTPAELARAREAIEREGATTIFVEPQFDAALAQRLAENAGVQVRRLDPIGDGDWFAMMLDNLAQLVAGIPPIEPENGPEGEPADQGP